jgi:N-acetylmuramoyl-L-alanine amidase
LTGGLASAHTVAVEVCDWLGMATTTSKPGLASGASSAETGVRTWPWGPDGASGPSADRLALDRSHRESSPLDALQALLAFSVLHEQLRRRKALAANNNPFDAALQTPEFDAGEQFVLDEVLQLVAERAVAITGADGLAIALAEGDEIVLRAAAGAVRPDLGARIDRDSAFSGGCFREAQIVNCDDTETDASVNVQACRQLGARSMVALPLCGRRRVIGVLEAFSSWPFAFGDGDVENLKLLAELVVGALRPEDEDRFAASAQVAATKLEATPTAAAGVPAIVVPEPAEIAGPAETDVEAEVSAQPADPVPFLRGALAAAPPEPHDPDPAPSRLRPLHMLWLFVVVAALSAGVWWKLHSGQPGAAAAKSQIARNPSTAGSQKSDADAPASNAAVAAEKSAARTAANSGASDAAVVPAGLSKFPRVTGIEHSSSPDSTTVIIQLEDQVQYEEHHLSGPDRVYFDLPETQLAPGLAGKPIPVGDALLRRIRVAQPVAGVTRVVLETARGATLSPRVSLETSPFRLVIELRKAESENKGAISAVDSEKTRIAEATPPLKQPDPKSGARTGKMRIAVDAGHGGWDLGTVGRGGLIEKEVVLGIAQRLGKLLETKLGAEVIFTRSDDNYISLDRRAKIANQAQADLFISVHANSSDAPSARGVETYYSSSFAAPGADAYAARSNPALAKTVPSLSQPALEERIKHSKQLASSVQHALYATLAAQNPGLPDRGIKQAGFEVLAESAMPGIVAEVSFVSSPADEQKLRADSYRDQIAEALFQGIAQYATAAREVKVAASEHRTQPAAAENLSR